MYLRKKNEFSLFSIIVIIRTRTGEGNGTLLQYSCLENPMAGGAWWAAVYGVAQSRTRLSDLAASAAGPGHMSVS